MDLIYAERDGPIGAMPFGEAPGRVTYRQVETEGGKLVQVLLNISNDMALRARE